MAATIKIKRSNTPGAVPSGGSLAAGELAVNLSDLVIFSSSDGSDIVRLSDSALANTNSAISQLNTNLTSTNTALRTLISDRLQVANAAATYQTIAIERAALANTNAYIASVSSAERSALANTNSYIASVQTDVDNNEAAERAALANTNSAISQLNTNLTSTNTAIRSLVSTQTARVDLVNTNLTSTNTALRTLISDRLQVANAAAEYQTIAIERAALANTNAYIATKADSASPTTSGVFTHTGRATISTNLTVSGNTHIDGNLTVEGGVTYISTSTLNVDDTMIKLAANNAADTVDSGVYGKYVISGNSAVKYSGYFRDATDGIFKFYEDLDTEPTTTVNTSDNNYNLAQLDAIIDGGTY